jgi:PIN domain nuclease of toxin-antitoxin system
VALLLDTHSFLWFVGNDRRLSRPAAERISDPEARVIVSVVSAWEIVIKSGTGKMVLHRPVEELWHNAVTQNGMDVLNVTVPHVFALGSLPTHHRDPFDRILIAQAIAEGHEIVSAETAFDAYPVTRIW